MKTKRHISLAHLHLSYMSDTILYSFFRRIEKFVFVLSSRTDPQCYSSSIFFGPDRLNPFSFASSAGIDRKLVSLLSALPSPLEKMTFHLPVQPIRKVMSYMPTSYRTGQRLISYIPGPGLKKRPVQTSTLP